MMTRFKRIIVENYKSINYAEINLLQGIYKVLGDNQDTTYTSNGAGKSSILQAIVLGLYNKDFSGANLDTLSNRFTGRPYLITIDFEAMYEGKLVDVTVSNPAGASRMRVVINGENAATGSILAIPLVEKLVGMGYATFRITHFITASTITHLTQNLSQPTLFNDILHIVELQELDKKLQVLSKGITEQLNTAQTQLKSLEQQSKLMEFKSKYNEDQLTEELDHLEYSLEALESKYSVVASELVATVKNLEKDVNNSKQLIEQTTMTLREGVCSMCGSILADKATLVTLNESLVGYKEKYGSDSDTLASVAGKLQVLNKKYHSSKSEIAAAMSSISQDLNIAKEVATIIPTDLNWSIKDTIKDYDDQLLFIGVARKEIKKGKVIQNVLDQFFSIIAAKIAEYLTLIRLDHFDITITNDRLGMAIILTQNGVEVPIDSLSNGEKTRLSLLILISMLDAMKTVSDSETNLVVLDEAAASFDKSGVEELGNLFAHMKHMGQSIFIITHGSEMDDVDYDYQLTISKINGSATAITTEL